MNLHYGQTVPELVCRLAAELRSAPQVPSRDGPTRELPGPTHMALGDPLRRFPLVPGRQGNPWVTMAEWPWLVAGRNDVGWLLPYLPRAADFSDDGEVWRAGYGPRLRDYGELAEFAHQRVDQLSEVVLKLRASHGTRQAAISLWDPMVDNEPGSKDYPCTDFIQAWIRDDLLHLHVVMRSNDLIWGLSGVNLYNWTSLQELLAACVGVGVGYYSHTSVSLHVYERHWSRLDYMSAPSPVPYPHTPEPLGKTTLHAYTEQCKSAVNVVENMRGRGANPRRLGVAGLEPGLRQWIGFMLLHDYLAGGPGEDWAILAKTVQRPDWWMGLLEFLVRTGRMTTATAETQMAERGVSGYMQRRYVLAHPRPVAEQV